jgi:hypothetical protein
MSTAHSAEAPFAERQWFIVGRWEEYEGEARANLLRIIGIGSFYIIELLNYYGLRLGAFEMPKSVGEVGEEFHRTVTALAVAWTMGALGTLLCLRRQFFPPALKYVTTGADVVLLTGILMVADGPRSPLVVGYFLVIAVAALRFQLRLIWFATLAAMAGYLVLLGYAKWFAGREDSVFGPRELTVPRYHELIFLLALALCGIVLGQVIRRVKALAAEFARRVEVKRPPGTQ